MHNNTIKRSADKEPPIFPMFKTKGINVNNIRQRPNVKGSLRLESDPPNFGGAEKSCVACWLFYGVQSAMVNPAGRGANM